MSITFACDCGKQLKVGDEYAGKRAKCPACGSVLAVPAGDGFPPAPPAPVADADDSYRMLDDDPPAVAPRPASDEYRRPRSLAPEPPRESEPDGPPRARYREVSEDAPSERDAGGESGGGPHLPTVFGGLFSMALGGLFCWLRGGVSIVGIILLIAGLVSFVKGLLGYQDN